MLTTDLQEFRFCFSWLMNRRLALMGPCREHIARASLASPAPSNWAGGMAPQGKVSSELGCVPAVGPCRDPPPPPPWTRALGRAPRCHRLLEAQFWGVAAPTATSRLRLFPSLGRNCWHLPWGPALEGAFGVCAPGDCPLLLCPPPSRSSPAAVPHSPYPLRPPPCVPSPRWRQPPSPTAPVRTGRSPAPPGLLLLLGGALRSAALSGKRTLFFFFFSRTNNHSSKITAHLFKVRHSVFSGKCVLRTS